MFYTNGMSFARAKVGFLAALEVADETSQGLVQVSPTYTIPYTDHCQLYGQFFAGQAGIRQEGIENLYGLPR
ncbi:MAG: hypothetical protein O7E51_16770 [Acidobacteria bacterium]|nr:hypothetical protein [Acidobacteriota bacterium]